MQPPIGINKQSKRQSQNPVQQLSDSLFFFLFSSVELLFFLSFLSLSQKQHFSAGKQASQHSFSVRQNEDNIKSAKRYVKNATIIVSVLLDCMIILSLWVEDNMFSWQFYAIVGILVALGTIVTPILNKVRKSEEIKSVSQINMEEQKEKISLNTTEDDLKMLSYFKDKGYILDEEFEIISSRITKKDS